MQIIENWTGIVGIVESIHSESGSAKLIAVKLKVTRASSVEGFQNLLADAEGRIITVQVPQQIFKKFHLQPGMVVSCRVRRAGANRFFLHPDHFSVMPT
jgi:hypothetical protein